MIRQSEWDFDAGITAVQQNAVYQCIYTFSSDL